MCARLRPRDSSRAWFAWRQLRGLEQAPKAGISDDNFDRRGKPPFSPLGKVELKRRWPSRTRKLPLLPRPRQRGDSQPALAMPTLSGSWQGVANRTWPTDSNTQFPQWRNRGFWPSSKLASGKTPETTVFVVLRLEFSGGAGFWCCLERLCVFAWGRRIPVVRGLRGASCGT